jgi:Zn-dependent peptidase ImmA (M78 family)
MTDRLNRARALFRAALDSRGLQLAADDSLAESLARIASFCADVVDGTRPQVHGQVIPFTTKASTELAGNIRRQLDVGDADPLFDLASLLATRLNTLVFPIRHSQVASACAILDNRPIIFISSELGIEQLLGCARELAHMLMLCSRTSDDSLANFTLRSDMARRAPQEYFATNFAIELLVPTRAFAVALRKVRELLKVKNRAVGDIEMLYLARIFGVTFSAIARKCERAQLLPPGGALTLEKFIVKNFGSAEQRANDLGLPDRPDLYIPIVPATLLPAIEHRIKTGGLSRAQAAEALSTSEEMLTLVLARSEQALEGFWQ